MELPSQYPTNEEQDAAVDAVLTPELIQDAIKLADKISLETGVPPATDEEIEEAQRESAETPDIPAK